MEISYIFTAAQLPALRVRALVAEVAMPGDELRWAGKWMGSGWRQPPGEAIGAEISGLGAAPVEQPLSFQFTEFSINSKLGVGLALPPSSQYLIPGLAQV